MLNTEGVGFIFEPTLISDVQTRAYNFVNPASIRPPCGQPGPQPLQDLDQRPCRDSIDVSATRRLYDLPGGPLSLALGGQFRYEAVHNPDINTNNEVAAGDGAVNRPLPSAIAPWGACSSRSKRRW